MIGGLDIIEDPNAVERYEDWSRVRSPSRALRRLRYGHRQNIVVKVKPAAFHLGGRVIAHPSIVRALRARISMENAA